MQAIMETLFDILYLCTVISVGILMLIKAKGRKQYQLFGIMAVLLGAGDAFHLIPRAWGLCTTGLEANAAALGIGKLITSITMTVFYVILYYIWKERYHIKGKKLLTGAVLLLAGARVLLCLLPQNEWLNYHAPLNYAIYRNIPFAILGILLIVLFYQKAKEYQDKHFRFLWLAIILSFGFYLPVVLFSSVYPLVGILMIPKTLAYVWIVFMGFFSLQDELKKERK